MGSSNPAVFFSIGVQPSIGRLPSMSIGTKAMMILDDCQLERTFIMIGLHAAVDKSWKVTYYKNSAETAGAGHFDGLDAMSDADGWLNY